MITGMVTSFHQATIRLIVRGPTGQTQEIEAVIDTGFDGALSLSPADIAALGLPWRHRGRVLLADGTTSLFDIYEATVLWDGAPRRVAVDTADIDPLVGMRLLDGYELTVQAIVGGQVLIKVLP
jgi:clan AA aspartic protease